MAGCWMAGREQDEEGPFIIATQNTLFIVGIFCTSSLKFISLSPAPIGHASNSVNYPGMRWRIY